MRDPEFDLLGEEQAAKIVKVLPHTLVVWRMPTATQGTALCASWAQGVLPALRSRSLAGESRCSSGVGGREQRK